MSSSDTIKKLFTLGSIEHNTPWINYLEFGLSEKELPQLLELLTAPALQNAAIDSKEIWVPQHIWRALGQLGDERSIPKLVASLNILALDDDAQQELPTVFAMIGAETQSPLGCFLHNTKNSETARIIAAQALQNIAQQHPESRASTVQQLTKQCAALDAATPRLNTRLLCSLLDLNAKESINEIRALYQTEIIDTVLIGDIEDVEIALGLRNERETPRPDYGHVHSRKRHQQPPIDIPEISLDDELNHYLKKYGHNNSVVNCSELDGFFAAIICAPNTILPASWIPALWGDKTTIPEFPNTKSANLFTSAVMVFYNQIVRAFSGGTYSALFIEGPFAGESEPQVNEWCRGFMRGLKLWTPIDTQDQNFLNQQLKPIALLTINEQEKGLQTAIETSAHQLFKHFVTQRRPTEVVPSETAKAGRNAPCPCGSGKKFKKCCLH